MTEYFIARQPIFDRQLKLYAYELLFRSSRVNAAPVDVDGETATAQVLSTSSDIGLERLVGRHHAFINLPQRFLDEPELLPLPPEQLVLEILETVDLDGERLDALRWLDEQGYTLALDDFVYDARFEEVLPLVEIVKMEVPAIPPDEWASEIARLKSYGCRVLAEKVETEDEFKRLAELGCDYFQGFFFARPKVVSGRRLSSNKLALLQLLARLNDPTVDIDTLSDLVSRDVALCVRALNYVNSAATALTRRVDSVREAVVYLGREKLRNWVVLFTMASVDDKPSELMTMALARGRFCELVARRAEKDDPGAFFTVGLFSVLDALMDAPMEEVLDQLALSDDMRAALADGEGAKGRALEIAIALERGEHERVDLSDMPTELLADLHLDATQWADGVMTELNLS